MVSTFVRREKLRTFRRCIWGRQVLGCLIKNTVLEVVIYANLTFTQHAVPIGERGANCYGYLLPSPFGHVPRHLYTATICERALLRSMLLCIQWMDDIGRCRLARACLCFTSSTLGNLCRQTRWEDISYSLSILICICNYYWDELELYISTIFTAALHIRYAWPSIYSRTCCNKLIYLTTNHGNKDAEFRAHLGSVPVSEDEGLFLLFLGGENYGHLLGGYG